LVPKFSGFCVRFRRNSGDHEMNIVEQRQGRLLTRAAAWVLGIVHVKNFVDKINDLLQKFFKYLLLFVLFFLPLPSFAQLNYYLYPSGEYYYRFTVGEPGIYLPSRPVWSI